MDIKGYDHYIVMFSGGKDSTACFLHLLEMGVDINKIEIWHHLIDGQPSAPSLMDWEVTADYCRCFADHFNMPVYFSWKQGGFIGEMLRKDAATAATWFETPGGLQCSGGNGRPNTRLQFPQVSGDLSVRWCSAYLKIMVAQAAIRGQERFYGKRTLIVTGERGQESPQRSKYAYFEPHSTDLRGSLKSQG